MLSKTAVVEMKTTTYCKHILTATWEPALGPAAHETATD